MSGTTDEMPDAVLDAILDAKSSAIAESLPHRVGPTIIEGIEYGLTRTAFDCWGVVEHEGKTYRFHVCGPDLDFAEVNQWEVVR